MENREIVHITKNIHTLSIDGEKGKAMKMEKNVIRKISAQDICAF